MTSKILLLLGLPLLALGAQNRLGAPAASGVVNRGTPRVTAPANSFAAAGQICLCGADCAADATTASTPTTLPANELNFMIEEERLAHDFYVAMAAQWNLRLFTNLSVSESQHVLALTELAATAGIVPPAAQAGVYVSAELQALYNALRGLAQTSVTAALQAGALIEETDILDLRRLATQATDAGSLRVLSRLEEASANHLAACARSLAALGITYQPQLLTEEDYAALIAGAVSPGSGNGNSNAWRGGR